MAADGHGRRMAVLWGRDGKTTGSLACTTVAMKHPEAGSEFDVAWLDFSHRMQHASLANTCQGVDHPEKALFVHGCPLVSSSPAPLISLSEERTFGG